MWWPRLAIGTAMAALLLGASAIWWRANQSDSDAFQLAINQATAAKELNRLAIAPPPAQPAPQAKASSEALGDTLSGAAAEPGFTESASSRSDEGRDVKLADSGKENAGALNEFADVKLAEKDRLAADASQAGQKRAPGASEQSAPQTSQPLVASAGAAARRKKTEVAMNFRQQFSQLSTKQAFRGEAKTQPAANVLQNFQIEQNGREIRVVDADGSTYTGEFERLSKNDSRNLQKQNEATNEGFYFRASGFNDSLKKSLVFEGNYIVPAPAESQEKRKATSSRQNEEMPAARIVGTAKINGEAPVIVDAVVVSPK